MKQLRFLIPVALVVLVLAQAATTLHWFGWGNPDGAVPVPAGGPFQLTAPDGRVVTDRDLRGKWVLVCFGDTSDADASPATLNNIARALDMLGPRAADVAPLFITVDPARDTPAVMGAYTARFDPRILGLTGTPEQIAQAEAAYRVHAAPEAHPQQGRVAMDQDPVLVIMDREGRFADRLKGNAAPEAIAAKLRALDR